MAHTDIMTHGNLVIRRLHSPDGNKSFGIIVLPVDYDGSDPTKIGKFDNILDARLSIGAYDRKNVDRVDSTVIFKLIIDGTSFGYGYMLDNAKLMRCGSLAKAREMLGWKPATSVKLTPPKSSHPQNQKGYDPHNRR